MSKKNTFLKETMNRRERKRENTKAKTKLEAKQILLLECFIKAENA